MHARLQHLNSVASGCNNALDEDIVIQAHETPEGLDGRIVEDCLNHWIGRFAADVPKEAPVRMEDDDITSNGCPASWHTLSGTMMAAHACDCRKSVVLRRMPEHCWLQGRGYINTCAPSEGVGDLFSYKAVTDVKGGKHGQ